MPSRGYTLTELLVVATIIAIGAAVAVPTLAPGDSAKLDFVATEIAASMRFARSEAQRLGTPLGVSIDAANKRVRVFRLDTGTSPPTAIYDVRHPIDKHLYDRDFTETPYRFSGSLTATPTFRGNCTMLDRTYFDGNGAAWCADPQTVLLDVFEIGLELGNRSASIDVNGIDGRVTVQ